MVGGNGFVEMGMFIVILIGMIIGGVVVGIEGSGECVFVVSVVVIVLVGWFVV